MNRYRRKLFITFFTGLLVLLGSLAAFAWDGLQMDVLDVGQGLSVLISCGDHYALYDGGGRDSSSYVVSYLQEHGVTHLDYVISSHYDEDHLAGLIGVLYTTNCDYVLSADYAADTEIYHSFQKAVETKGLTQLHPSAGTVYYMGDAVIDVVGPVETGGSETDTALGRITTENLTNVNVTNVRSSDPNNSCVAIRVSYGDNAFLMCGDAQAQEEYEMLQTGEDLSADVYVVSHHGSSTSSTEEFLEAVSPKEAVISCGAGNDYGHPTEEVLERLAAHGCSIYRTDLQGEITAQSDGENVFFNQNPTDDLTPGTYISEEREGYLSENGEDHSADVIGETAQGETDSAHYEKNASGEGFETGGDNTGGSDENGTTGNVTYICNRNTGVFHYPDCGSVSQMSEKNKIYTSQSREELIEEGYRPCGNCRP